MISYIGARLLSSLLVLFIVSVVAFVLMNVVEGDPARAMLELNATEERLAAVRASLGLDKPLHERYAHWIYNAFQGDLGLALTSRIPITELFREKLVPTMQLGILALIVVLSLSIPVGVLAALRPGSKTEVAASTTMIVGASIPEYLSGIALVYIVGFELELLPRSGYVPLSEDVIESLKHMVLPVIALSLISTTLVMRQTRSAMINVLQDDYIRTARAKGLRDRAVIIRHGLRNAMIPVITVFGFQVGVVFGGAVITEQVFAIPGMGRLFVQSVVQVQDYSVVQNLVMFFAIITVAVNLLVDLTYPLIDPRIRQGISA
ncbi:MAG: ABC transporter permease [Chloroflexota bacterium]|nr:ABC transporter permease [Chloroflexota bacterium]MDE2894390.1 ABC transporter permease [Chloroflexota bacterium]